MSEPTRTVKQSQVKSRKFDPTTGVFEGYAAVFGNVDSDGDIIEKGAFSKFLESGFDRVKILALHNDQWLPIGKPLELYEDDVGLYIKAKIVKTGIGADVWQLLVEGVLDELSIGYVIIDAYIDGDAQHLTELALDEVSVVTWAANERAKILKVKSRQMKSTGTPEELLALADQLEQAARAIREQVGAPLETQGAPAPEESKSAKHTGTLPPTIRSGSKRRTAFRKTNA